MKTSKDSFTIWPSAIQFWPVQIQKMSLLSQSFLAQALMSLLWWMLQNIMESNSLKGISTMSWLLKMFIINSLRFTNLSSWISSNIILSEKEWQSLWKPLTARSKCYVKELIQFCCLFYQRLGKIKRLNHRQWKIYMTMPRMGIELWWYVKEQSLRVSIKAGCTSMNRLEQPLTIKLWRSQMLFLKLKETSTVWVQLLLKISFKIELAKQFQISRKQASSSGCSLVIRLKQPLMLDFLAKS